MASSRSPRAFSATGATVLLVAVAVLVIGLLVDAVVRAGIGSALLLAPWPLLVLWVVYVVGVASDIRADEEGVQVQNMLRRTWIPWSRVEQVGLRWQLEFTLDDGRVIACLGGPSRSRPRRLGPERTREKGNADTDDGIARLRKLRAQSTAPADAVVVRSWDGPVLIALAVIVIWAVAAVLIAST